MTTSGVCSSSEKRSSGAEARRIFNFQRSGGQRSLGRYDLLEVDHRFWELGGYVDETAR
jgi:hypothetical protein